MGALLMGWQKGTRLTAGAPMRVPMGPAANIASGAAESVMQTRIAVTLPVSATAAFA